MNTFSKYILSVIVLGIALLTTSCDKVSPAGVLMAGTAVDDRVKMSIEYYTHVFDRTNAYDMELDTDSYTFLVAADSHMVTDTTRMAEMFRIALRDNDLFIAHLGDIADTKAEYYAALRELIATYKSHYVDKYFDFKNGMYYRKGASFNSNGMSTQIFQNYDDIPFPFYPVVGNHDITHNGWALWADLFHSSFYEFNVIINDSDSIPFFDHFIFLDTASGTLGSRQIDALNNGMLTNYDMITEVGAFPRNAFLFSHTNLFRPETVQFSSTFPREEMYYLFHKLDEWGVNGMFCGHVHAWDDRWIGSTRYITLESMSERNCPAPGDYLVRVHVKADHTWDIEKVHMSTSGPGYNGN